MQKEVQPEEERANELFFQLSSMDRRRILSELQKENLKLNETARRLDMTPTETLRQLQRLTEAGLLEKMSDGRYRPTTYALLVLETSTSLGFFSRYREYFLSHDASLLPHEFRVRLGELSGGALIMGTVETLNWVTEFFKRAEKKIDATVVGFEIQDEILRRRVQEGLKVRWLIDESFLPRAKSILHSDKRLPEMRAVPRVFGHIATTDKEAVLTLRRNDGSLSFDAFIGKDASFLRWAEDLYAHEWEKAKPWYP